MATETERTKKTLPISALLDHRFQLLHIRDEAKRARLVEECQQALREAGRGSKQPAWVSQTSSKEPISADLISPYSPLHVKLKMWHLCPDAKAVFQADPNATEYPSEMDGPACAIMRFAFDRGRQQNIDVSLACETDLIEAGFTVGEFVNALTTLRTSDNEEVLDALRYAKVIDSTLFRLVRGFRSVQMGRLHTNTFATSLAARYKGTVQSLFKPCAVGTEREHGDVLFRLISAI